QQHAWTVASRFGMQPRWIGRLRRPSYGLSWPIRWSGFVLLTAILSVATVAGMIVFTWLTLAGMPRINLGSLEKYEVGLISLLLCAVGVRLTKLQRKLHREHHKFFPPRLWEAPNDKAISP